MRPGYLFLPAVLALMGVGMDSRVALASHLEGLRGAGEGLAVSTFWLSLGAFLGFLVLGSFIVLGLRYLHRWGSESREEQP